MIFAARLDRELRAAAETRAARVAAKREEVERAAAREESAKMLSLLADDTFLQVLAACSDAHDGGSSLHADVPLFEAVKGLACSKGLLQRLHRLRPLVGTKSLAVVQCPPLGPWRVVLLYMGVEVSEELVEQARQGRVRTIEGPLWPPMRSPTPAVARRVVPELLGAGGSLLELKLDCMKLNGSWAAIFGEAAVCSPVLRKLRLQDCGLQGPLPELRLPALRELRLSKNQFTGSLEPLQECTALRVLALSDNQLTGDLEPLRGCTGLHAIWLSNNHHLGGGLEPLRGCTRLSALHCCETSLTGGLEPLRGCTGLEHLSLNNNHLTGDLDALQGCTVLEILYLQCNSLTGGLDPLRGCTLLQVLWLFENHLTGGLEPLQRCTVLWELLLYNNRFSGGLEPLRGCTSLGELDVRNNGLTGGLEPLRGCTELQGLSLKNNQLVPSDEDKAHFLKQCGWEESEKAGDYLGRSEEEESDGE